MKKNSGTQYAVNASLVIIEDCASVNEAIGAAVMQVLEEKADYTVASVCAAEVGGSAAEYEEIIAAAEGVLRAYDLNYGKGPSATWVRRLRESLQRRICGKR